VSYRRPDRSNCGTAAAIRGSRRRERRARLQCILRQEVMSYVWLGYINKLEVDVGSEGMELSRLRLERGRSDGSEALFSFYMNCEPLTPGRGCREESCLKIYYPSRDALSDSNILMLHPCSKHRDIGSGLSRFRPPFYPDLVFINVFISRTLTIGSGAAFDKIS
jgi:hypothetical protein